MNNHPIVFDGIHRVSVSYLDYRNGANVWRAGCTCGWWGDAAGRIVWVGNEATHHLDVMAGCAATVDRADGPW
jgi:hypothetical protein